jgi:hypothetical protein
MEKGTFDVVDRSAVSQQPITAKWVYQRKSTGAPKARLVARGFSQQAGVDFRVDQTYSPVAQTWTFRLVLALAATLPHGDLA